MPKGQGKAKERELANRRIKVLKLRTMGKSQQDIARELGVSEATVSLDIQASIRQVQYEAVDELRVLSLLRIDRALTALEPKIAKAEVEAIKAMVMLMGQQNKYVPGLEVQVTNVPMPTEGRREEALSIVDRLVAKEEDELAKKRAS